ncbi:hypothetical protein K7432_010131 [Basidiobolus ranarum]|uniref:Uncharacterized protein n=1 Tax=Basidiobolus ranarum TaxID=34480 RepID=A0ABR2VVZ1_9FUNG
MMKFVCILLISALLVQAQKAPTTTAPMVPAVRTNSAVVQLPQQRKVTAVARATRADQTVFVTLTTSDPLPEPTEAPVTRVRSKPRRTTEKDEPETKSEKSSSTTSTTTSTSTSSSTSTTSNTQFSVSTPTATQSSGDISHVENPSLLLAGILLGYLFY